mmetsp:Transcript_56404/g.91309  ORF Transcript_56404/g.91309 Transcript_56404/m.91309 type:complete len:444 (-) Transcript_56404:49-1380(-)
MEEGNGASNGHAEHAPAQPKPEKKINFYDVLGVAKEATEAEIKKAYKKKSLQLHPDKNRDDPDAEHKFAALSQAYTCLMDPVKRIDHNRELSGGDVGWGWNQAAAQERAKDYRWNADDLVFNIGAQLHQARSQADSGWQEHAVRCGKFWAISVLAIALLEALVIVTALGVGMPKACTIWAAILGTLLLLGLVVSIKTDDWNFPGGSLLAIVALVALLGGLVAADLLVQAKWIKGGGCDEKLIDTAEPPCTNAGVYKFKLDTEVDRANVIEGASKSICVAPIVPRPWVGTSYKLTKVNYWAVDAGCCSGGVSTCTGWDQPWGQGINWFKDERPSSVFFNNAHLDFENVSKAIPPDPYWGQTVRVEWRQNANSHIRGLFDAPAWSWLAVVTLLWPLVLCLLWTAVTLGSCLFLPRMHCHQPLEIFCLYVGSGCPSCWSELDLMDH